MISVDRVYKTVLTLANSDIRGNVTPSELKLVLNDVVNEVYEGYLVKSNDESGESWFNRKGLRICQTELGKNYNIF
jgi:hypothetical protein